MGTLITDYFNRDDRVEEFLIRYNDGFEDAPKFEGQLEGALGFLDELQLPEGIRAWQRADLFTLIVEIHRALYKTKIRLGQKMLRMNLEKFYTAVDELKDELNSQVKLELGSDDLDIIITKQQVRQYYRATTDATNDRGSRIQRGSIMREIVHASKVTA